MKLSELLDKPEKWTKKYNARNSYGFSVNFDSPDATCWCLVGGMRKLGFQSEDYFGKNCALLTTIKKLFPSRFHEDFGPARFNDHPDTTFKDIQLVIKEAGL